MCRCASPQISGVLVYIKPLWLKFGKVIVHFYISMIFQKLELTNTFVCKIYLQVDYHFFYLKYFKNLEYKASKHGIGRGVQNKSRGHVLKKFPGGFAPRLCSHCPPFICHSYVLISKISGVAQGLVFLEFIGNGNSIGPHPDHSHLHCHTQI